MGCGQNKAAVAADARAWLSHTVVVFFLSSKHVLLLLGAANCLSCLCALLLSKPFAKEIKTRAKTFHNSQSPITLEFKADTFAKSSADPGPVLAAWQGKAEPQTQQLSVAEGCKVQ